MTVARISGLEAGEKTKQGSLSVNGIGRSGETTSWLLWRGDLASRGQRQSLHADREVGVHRCPQGGRQIAGERCGVSYGRRSGEAPSRLLILSISPRTDVVSGRAQVPVQAVSFVQTDAFVNRP
jgi:hypothetical protein